MVTHDEFDHDYVSLDYRLKIQSVLLSRTDVILYKVTSGIWYSLHTPNGA